MNIQNTIPSRTAPFSQTWNLDEIYPGGARSPALLAALHHLKHDILYFSRKFHQLSDIKKGILHFQEIEGKCQDLQYFIGCLLAQNVDDQEALRLQSEISQIAACSESLGEEISALLAGLDKEMLRTLLLDEDIQPIAFHLKERYERFLEKLPLEQENLARELGIDGYHGWSEIYNAWIGDLRIPSPFPPEPPLSVGQAENRLSHPDRQVRQAWFHRFEEIWTQHETLAAQMLNHLAGYRIHLNAAREWPSIFHDPLFLNRMEAGTLETMWTAIERHRHCLLNFFQSKAGLLEIEKLSWFDAMAPLSFDSTTISYDEAARFIIEHFTAFSPSMGAFARHAFEKGWIEAEDRAGKRPGGFCAPLMRAKQSRIFMTYSGTMNNVFTLAHELGHAYHSYEMRDLPFFAQNYRMNVAETASTLAEAVIIDSMIEHSKDHKTVLALLDNKLQRAVIFLMNIHARFLFEMEFYQERKKGFVLAKELNAMMERAQRQAFGDAFSEWHPRFWISKQHFYITDVPFYNFPYTFGYLFSQGIYAHLKNTPSAEKAYAALLRDSGSMPVEELASRHLGVDLGKPHFWEMGLKLVEKDVAHYLKLASSV